MSDTPLDLSALYEAILTGDASAATELTASALAAGHDPQSLIADRMIPAMDEVGRRFEEGEFFVPELLIAGRAMKSALALLRPLLAARGIEPVGRVVIGTVKGDMHDIGKGLVASMLEGAGFDVIDLGVDVPAQKFIDQAQEKKADVIALSALLTTTMPAMKSTIAALRKDESLRSCKVVVGGAPITQQFADAAGADGYSSNANGAVTIVRKLLSL